MIKNINIFRYLNNQQLSFTIINCITSVFICYNIYILNINDTDNIKSLTLYIVIVDLIIKRLLTQSRIYSFSYFLYLQIRKKKLFFYYLADAFWSVSNLFLLITILYILIFKEFCTLDFIKIIFTIFVINTIMERSLRLIKTQTIFYTICLFFIYLIYIYHLYSTPILGVLCVLSILLILLYISFKKHLLIQ